MAYSTNYSRFPPVDGIPFLTMNQPVPAQSETPLSIRALAERTVPATGQAEPPSIPDYELLRRIGGGSYGDVWLARSATGALRAVKIVWRHTFDDDRPFQREFEGIQNFERLSREHPSQLALYHVSRSEGYFFYVMELADAAEQRVVSNQCSVNSHQCSVINNRSATPDAASRHAASLITDRLITEYSPKTLRADLAQGRLPAVRVLEIGL